MVSSYNLINDNYPFKVAPTYWLRLEYQYVLHLFLLLGVLHILRNTTETCKPHLMYRE